jgi:hypothetical protein
VGLEVGALKAEGAAPRARLISILECQCFAAEGADFQRAFGSPHDVSVGYEPPTWA